MKRGFPGWLAGVLTVLCLVVLIDLIGGLAARVVVGREALDAAYAEQFDLLRGMLLPDGLATEIAALHAGQPIAASPLAWILEFGLSGTSTVRAATIQGETGSFVRLTAVLALAVLAMRIRSRAVVESVDRRLHRRRTPRWGEWRDSRQPAETIFD